MAHHSKRHPSSTRPRPFLHLALSAPDRPRMSRVEWDFGGGLGGCRWPLTRRNCLDASTMPAAHQCHLPVAITRSPAVRDSQVLDGGPAGLRHLDDRQEGSVAIGDRHGIAFTSDVVTSPCTANGESRAPTGCSCPWRILPCVSPRRCGSHRRPAARHQRAAGGPGSGSTWSGDRPDESKRIGRPLPE